MSSASRAPAEERAQQHLRVLTNATRSFANASRSTDELLRVIVEQFGFGLGGRCALSLLDPDGVHFSTPHVYFAHLEKGASSAGPMSRLRPRVADHPWLERALVARSAFF